mgnify:CR=1 FL=1
MLFRHAKSSWESLVEDRDRGLTEKGIERTKNKALVSTKIINEEDLSEKSLTEVHARKWLHELVANISMIAMGRENIDHQSSPEE